MTPHPTSRSSRKSMVGVASATRADVALAQLTLSAAGIRYVIATDPIDRTAQVLVDPADAEDAAAVLF
jgi:hypothetical protein